MSRLNEMSAAKPDVIEVIRTSHAEKNRTGRRRLLDTLLHICIEGCWEFNKVLYT